MFKRRESKEKKKTIYPSSSNVRLYTVSTANVLLARPYHRKLLKELQIQAAAPQEYYDALYSQLITDFVEFVQLLPESNEGHVGGILNQGLLRAKEALLLSKGHKNVEGDVLWKYVLFTSALLLDLGRIISDQQIMICGPHGKSIAKWTPLLGTMAETGQHYITRPITGDTDGLARRATVLLAHQLMPKAGMDWIAQDTEALASWLALLTGHFDEARGDVCSILSVTKERIAQLLKTGEMLEDEFMLDFSELLDTEYADAFLAWLKRSLEDRSISINEEDSVVNIVEEGVFLDMPEAVEEFLRHYSKSVDPALFYQQFNFIGITSWGEQDYRYQKYVSEYPGVKGQRGFGRGAAGISTFGQKQAGQPYAGAGQTKTHTGIVIQQSKLIGADSKTTLPINRNMHGAVRGQAGQYAESLLRAPGGGLSPISWH